MIIWPSSQNVSKNIIKKIYKISEAVLNNNIFLFVDKMDISMHFKYIYIMIPLYIITWMSLYAFDLFNLFVQSIVQVENNLTAYPRVYLG